MRILIANPFGIGDVLFSLPLVQALRKLEKEVFIGFVCNGRTQELVGAWSELNWHLVVEKDAFRDAWRRSKMGGVRFMRTILAEVEQQHFDVMMDLSLGWQYGFLGWFARIPKRVGFNFRNRGKFLTHTIALDGFHNQSVAQYYLDLLPLMDLPRPAKAHARFELTAQIEQETTAVLEKLGVSAGKMLIGIVPGGGASWGPNRLYKQWPAHYWPGLIDSLAQSSAAHTLILGDVSENGLCQTILKKVKTKATVLAPAPSLLSLAGLLKRCRLVIGNDSGPMHLANAVGTKTVSIFGPVDGSIYGPQLWGMDLSQNQVISRGLACQPCYQSFRFPPCPWDNACLKGLDPAPVIQAAQALLQLTNGAETLKR